MIITITFPSALRFWLSASSLRLPGHIMNDRVRQLPVNASEGPFPQMELQDITETYNLEYPLHISVPVASRRSRSDDYIYHVLYKYFPEYGFIKLSDEVYLSSPELSFIEAANNCSFHMTVKAGNALCANYVSNINSELFQSEREQLTDPMAIKRFIVDKKLPGIKNARKAIQYVLENSNSPVETNLGALFNLPRMYGGYGMEHPILNYPVKLSKDGAEQLGRDMIRLDIGWAGKRVGLEYDSNMTHLTQGQHAYDKARATALSLSGYKIMYVTAEQLRNFRNIEKMADHMRKMLGMHSRSKDLEKFRELRWQVVHDLIFNRGDIYNLFH